MWLLLSFFLVEEEKDFASMAVKKEKEQQKEVVWGKVNRTGWIIFLNTLFGYIFFLSGLTQVWLLKHVNTNAGDIDFLWIKDGLLFAHLEVGFWGSLLLKWRGFKALNNICECN